MNKRKNPKLSVILSGMPSVGKTTAANEIAKKFQLAHLAGGDMLKEMAIERGYEPSGSEWWDSEQGMTFLSERKKNADFDREVDHRLVQALKKGGVVVTSYTVPWISKIGLKIWFAASQKTRAKRLAGRDGISARRALDIVKSRDSSNRRLYKRIYGIMFGGDLSPFNYIIDTENMSAREVADAACRIVSKYAAALEKGKAQS